MPQACSPFLQAQGVVLRGHILDAGLGVVGGDLAAHHPFVLAAGQQGDADGVADQFQGEGFGDGDGLEQVLHPQQGALALAGWLHRQQRRRRVVAVGVEQNLSYVDIHGRYLAIYWIG